MTEIFAEKRNYSRKLPAMKIMAYDTLGGHSAGLVIDISRSGFQLLTSEMHQPETLKELSIELPSAGTVHNVAIVAECLWCRSEDSENYRAGYEIRSISDQDEVALNYFMRDV